MVSGFKMSRFPALLRLRDLDVVELPRASRGGIGECALLVVVSGGKTVTGSHVAACRVATAGSMQRSRAQLLPGMHSKKSERRAGRFTVSVWSAAN